MANAASGTVSVVSLFGETAFTVVAEIPVGAEPRGCTVTPNGKRLFVSLFTEGAVAVIDTASRQVVAKVPVGGNPWALATTSDNDRDDDETVFVTQFFAEAVPGGPGEAFDDGRQGVVQFFSSTGQGPVGRAVLAPLADSGFTADRKLFCKQLNPAAHSDIYCPTPPSQTPPSRRSRPTRRARSRTSSTRSW